MSQSAVIGFMRKNITLVIGIPLLGILQLGWYKLQFNEDFVPENDRHVQLYSSGRWTFFKSSENNKN